jgi:hypothetical protein
MGIKDYKLKRDNVDYKKAREEHLKEISKKRLLENSSKKIKTTMIGAIAAIEEKFGWLWGEDMDQKVEFKELFEDVRSMILDKGNNQIRNLEAEFASYEIVCQKNKIVLPVLNKDKDNDR